MKNIFLVLCLIGLFACEKHTECSDYSRYGVSIIYKDSSSVLTNDNLRDFRLMIENNEKTYEVNYFITRVDTINNKKLLSWDFYEATKQASSPLKAKLYLKNQFLGALEASFGFSPCAGYRVEKMLFNGKTIERGTKGCYYMIVE